MAGIRAGRMRFSSVVIRGRVGALRSGLGEHGQGVVLSLIPMAGGPPLDVVVAKLKSMNSPMQLAPRAVLTC